MRIVLFLEGCEDEEMSGGLLPTPSYQGVFLWLTWNKTQLLLALQIQSLAVCLYNDQTHLPTQIYQGPKSESKSPHFWPK